MDDSLCGLAIRCISSKHVVSKKKLHKMLMGLGFYEPFATAPRQTSPSGMLEIFTEKLGKNTQHKAKAQSTFLVMLCP